MPHAEGGGETVDLKNRRNTHILVDGEGRGGVLEKNVGHSHSERPELRHLLAYLRRDEVAPPGRGGDGDGSLGPSGCPRLNLRRLKKTKIKSMKTFTAMYKARVARCRSNRQIQ